MPFRFVVSWCFDSSQTKKRGSAREDTEPIDCAQLRRKVCGKVLQERIVGQCDRR